MNFENQKIALIGLGYISLSLAIDYGLLYVASLITVGVPEDPRTVGIIQPILLLLFVGASRAHARVWLGDQYQIC